MYAKVLNPETEKQFQPTKEENRDMDLKNNGVRGKSNLMSPNIINKNGMFTTYIDARTPLSDVEFKGK